MCLFYMLMRRTIKSKGVVMVKNYKIFQLAWITFLILPPPFVSFLSPSLPHIEFMTVLFYFFTKYIFKSLTNITLCATIWPPISVINIHRSILAEQHQVHYTTSNILPRWGHILILNHTGNAFLLCAVLSDIL